MKRDLSRFIILALLMSFFLPVGAATAAPTILRPPTDTVNGHFGRSIAIDGSTMVVGESGAHSAHVYEKTSPGVWEHKVNLATLTSTDDFFGVSVAISGNRIVVGNANSQKIHVFERVGDSWTHETTLTSNIQTFGYRVAVDNTTIVVGAFNDNSGAGAIVVFKENNGNWGSGTKKTVAGSERLGSYVGVSGNHVVASAHNQFTNTPGKVYVWDNTNLATSPKLLTGSNGAAGEGFGHSVAIEDNRIVVGANTKDTESLSSSGAVYVFDFDGSNWTESAIITVAQGYESAGDNFGSSVDLETTGTVSKIVVGAINEDSSGAGVNSTTSPDNSLTNAGAAYLFEQDGTTWNQVGFLKASNPTAGALFGESVALSDGELVVGAYKADGDQTDSGAVYLFSSELADPVPANTTLPSISGAVGVGQTLSGDDGTWTNDPSTFSYQWDRCDDTGGSTCAGITSATSSSYVVVADDVDKTLKFTVTATNAAGSTTVSVTTSVVVDVPSNSQLPSISGTLESGETLTLTAGTWSYSPSLTYQWQRCDSQGSNCVDIAGETSGTYTLGVADVGSTIRVVEEATNAAGVASVSSAVTAVITSIPVSSNLPVITGDPGVGKTLTTTDGAWSFSPTSFAYQWSACDSGGNGCAPIGGATSNSFTLTSAEVGNTIRVSVTATNATGNAMATSSQTAVIVGLPANTALPTVSGTEGVGQTLTATSGTWDHQPGFAYQWQRCESDGSGCVSIGAGTTTYVAVADDAGKKISVVVTATNVAGAVSTTSALTGEIAAVPVNVSPPTFTGTVHSPSGTVALNSVLQGASGTWLHSPNFFPGWDEFNGTSWVSINNLSSLDLQSESIQAGTLIRHRVMASNNSLENPIAYSETLLVVDTPVNTSPTISGTVTLGSTLTPSSNWSQTPTLTYQWQRCDADGITCSNIAGETSGSYVLASADVGSTIRVIETAVNAAGTVVQTYSPTAEIAATPLNLTLPVVSGGTGAGQTLTASDGTWSYSPASFAYQWQQCEFSGSNCSNIANATSSSYVVVAADQGMKIKVLVTATNPTGNTVAESLATSIPLPVTNTGTPGALGSGIGAAAPMPQLSAPLVSNTAEGLIISWSIIRSGTNNDAVVYSIQHSEDSGTTWLVTSVTGSGLSRTALELDGGETYIFRVVSTMGNITAYSGVSSPITLQSAVVGVESAEKLTIGTFRGVVAVYTVGHLGSRLSMKVAGKWVVQDPLTNFLDHGFSRTVKHVRSGREVIVEVYIDRVRVAKETVLTK